MANLLLFGKNERKSQTVIYLFGWIPCFCHFLYFNVEHVVSSLHSLLSIKRRTFFRNINVHKSLASFFYYKYYFSYKFIMLLLSSYVCSIEKIFVYFFLFIICALPQAWLTAFTPNNCIEMFRDSLAFPHYFDIWYHTDILSPFFANKHWT